MNEGISNDKLTIANDLMFYNVMQIPDVCYDFLERITGKEIDRLTYLEGGKSLPELLSAKDASCAVFLEDDQNCRYVIEMNTVDTGNLAQKAAYYRSHINGHDPVQELQYDWYVILICIFDPYQEDLPIYTFRPCDRDADIELTGKDTIFINLAATDFSKVEISEDLSNLLKYMQTNQVTDDYTKMLNSRVEEINKADKAAGDILLSAAAKMAENKKAIKDENQ